MDVRDLQEFNYTCYYSLSYLYNSLTQAKDCLPSPYLPVPLSLGWCLSVNMTVKKKKTKTFENNFICEIGRLKAHQQQKMQ